jgi:hypothetical protein
VGFCKVTLAFVAANALEASSKANPIIRLFETVANFMAAPYFLSRVASGNGWGGPVRDQREKTLVFPHESPTMLPPGLCRKSRADKSSRQVASFCCRDGGFLTWAAKPSVRESPGPAINIEANLASFTSAPARSPTLRGYVCHALEVP